VPAPKTREEVEATVEPGETDARPAANAAPAVLSRFALDAKKYPLLASIGTNLTELAASGAIDPVIGRDAELDRLLDVISRRRANNPLLVGPPGVGKTALVHALALAIAQDDPIARGLDRRIVLEISAGSLVSGTGVRGALAEKLRRLVLEAKSAGDVLLFLDEIHAVIGAGEGPDDLASELKSVLARGELPCIGATTDAEAKKHFDKDPALARRFSIIHVGEPSVKEATAILRGLMHRYEEHHQLSYRLDAIEAAVELSVRFLPERHLPDKALSVLDLAGARARRASCTVVDVPAVAQVIADEAHVPIERLLLRDADRLLALEEILEERVVGQRAPLGRIADALRKGAAGFRGRRPLATFLFLGSTGVGKTETAKAIAEAMFGESNVVRFDMSEMSESHSVARLVGAPPGYVGHEAGGQLTEAVRRRPYSLVLLDEIEKAHPEVLLALLPLLDEGRLTDARGRTVDFTNTVVVLTSNLGAAEASQKTSAVGFGAQSDQAAAARSLEERTILAARRSVPPELWNRLDEPLYFAPITRPDALEIARRMLEKVKETLLATHGVVLIVEESVLSALADAGGFDPTLGARPMRRIVGRLVESPLATRVLGEDVRRGDRIVMRGRGATIEIDFEEPEEEAAE
jgi:ATP-dependent Clp protease ATP-binding subunit ClpC